ncbi:ABC transporter permease [Paenibacillus tritici]|uniref:ABC transporter permease n=1 Tax=Paenibacillus tritici TaxID=1873425 RepID=UPI001BA51978|nr:ABC transporter permease [Paenibacillus tritici]QUL56338.1 ABC transporter permease [Paenibacillus tritici]
MVNTNADRRAAELRLTTSQDYRQAGFAWAGSLIITLVLLLGSYDWEREAFKPYIGIACLIYGIFTLIQVLVTLLIRRDLILKGDIRARTRALGYIQLLSLVTANVFLVTAALQLIQKRKSPEYTLAVYTLLTQIAVIGISALNLYKPYVADTFLTGMFVLLAVAVFHLLVVVLTARFVSRRQISRKLVWIAYPLLLTSLTGNLFALALGIILLVRIRNRDNPAVAGWEDVLERMTRNTTAMLGLLFIAFLFSVSVCSYVTFDYGMAVDNNYSLILQPPSLAYPLGTDNFGRCLFTRIIFGARISLIVGVMSTVLPLLLGGTLGAISGYYGRYTDNIIMRALDVLYAIPGILLAIAIIAAFGANTVNLILALSVGAIPTYARTMRANVLQVSTYEYVDAARAFGSSNRSIIFKHIVPNSLAPMIVKATLTIGGAVISTSSLSFLGLGIEPHIPEWGNILKLGSTYLETNSYLAIFPGLAIIALVLSFNFFGDGLRDALDPKMD